MKELTTTLIQALLLDSEISKTNPAEETITQLKTWGAGIFRLVVMGEIKKGKSSFINAMLGIENLVPVSSNVATSTIFKIRYASQLAYVVHFINPNEKSPLSISAEELNHYGTEDGNPNNREEVSFIEVQCPAPLLKSGIVIIDTPGLGGLFKHHKKITWEYIPKADAVFFVTDSVESPIGQLELECIDAVRKITPHIYFAQSKTMAVDTDARVARKANNLSILSQATGKSQDSIPYFLLDSQLKFEAQKYQDLDDLNDSGYPQLLAYVNNVLLPAKQKILAENCLKVTQPALQHIQEVIASKKAILASDSKEKIAAMTQRITEKQQALKDWQKKEKPKMLTLIQSGMQSIRLDAMKALSRCRPNGDIQAEIETLIDNATSIEELQAVIAVMHENLPGFMSAVFDDIRKDITSKTKTLLNEIATSRELAQLELSVYEQPTDYQAATSNSLARAYQQMGDSSTFNDIRTGLYGGMAGGALGGIVGAMIGSIVPGIGTAIGFTVGQAIGGFWGGYEASSLQKSQELKQAKNQTFGAMSQHISTMYMSAQTELEQLILQINSKINLSIQDFLNRKEDDLQQEINDLAEHGKKSQEELNDARKEIAAMDAQLLNIHRAIKTYIRS